MRALFRVKARVRVIFSARARANTWNLSSARDGVRAKVQFWFVSSASLRVKVQERVRVRVKGRVT